jgi:type II secretory pathway pseudopilin PulG
MKALLIIILLISFVVVPKLLRYVAKREESKRRRREKDLRLRFEHARNERERLSYGQGFENPNDPQYQNLLHSELTYLRQYLLENPCPCDEQGNDLYQSRREYLEEMSQHLKVPLE